MSAEDRLVSLALSVSDGAEVDWQRAARDALADRDRLLMARLQELEAVIRFHRASLGPALTPENTTTFLPPALREEEEEPAPVEWAGLKLLEEVGRGSFGRVYRAWDPRLEREVALKLLRPSDGAKVVQEGRLLARVRHPHVVTVYGAEEREGRVGLWMEFVRGRTLAELVREHGPFGAREAALMGVDLAAALAAVHRVGLVHRDVKAQNVMREEGGRILLMDFGAGVEAGREATSLGLSGTPLYMAPETLRGAPATTLSDVYSLGVLLYHLVTASYPVRARTVPELVQAHEEGAPVLLRDARPELPEAFTAVVERALAPLPQRYASAGALQGALAASLGLAAAAPRRNLGEALRHPAALPLAAAVVAASAGLLAWRELRVPAAAPTPAAATAAPAAAAEEAYDVDAGLYLTGGPSPRPLRAGDRVRPGDRLFLELQASRDVHVYVVNEDERGEAYLLFPLPGHEPQNPLPAGGRHRLPGRRQGEPMSWQVTSAGGREHFLVVASPARLGELERELAALPAPREGAVAVPLSRAAAVRLRGLGGLTPAEPAGRAQGRITALARGLGGRERVQGAWVRQIHLDNPAR